MLKTVNEFPPSKPNYEEKQLKQISYFRKFESLRDVLQQDSIKRQQHLETMTKQILDGKYKPEQLLINYTLSALCECCDKLKPVISCCLACGNKICTECY